MFPVFFIPQGKFRTGQMSLLAVLWCLLFSHTIQAAKITPIDTIPVFTQQLQQVDALAKAGAPKLALRTLSLHQSKLTYQQPDWMLWEKKRIQIFRANQQWQEIDQRLEKIPDKLSLDFKLWAKTHRSVALIKTGKSASALAELRKVMWAESTAMVRKQRFLRAWRRTILDAYMTMGKSHDAYLASAHYFRDYPTQSTAEKLLHIRILLSAGYAEDAADLIKSQKQSNELFYLSMLAKLKQSPKLADSVLKRLLRKVRAVTPTKKKSKTTSKKNSESITALWAVIAEAAAISGDRATQANALEHVVIKLDELPQGLFSINADTLWQSYIELATETGNQSQLLIGQDTPWFSIAAKTTKKQPVRARALYAFLSINAGSKANRDKAVTSFSALLKQRKEGGKLMQQLYLNSKRYQNIPSIPLSVRHTLVGISLQQSNLTQASAIMASIELPPENADVYFWRLRRARILVMGGESKHAISGLSSILDDYPRLTNEQYEQYLQVLFDLQTVQLHQAALDLFNKVLPQVSDVKLRRELFFWMAESSKALQQYTHAARYYMSSAMLPAVDSMDPWAQTARYQAAESLSRAGLVGDARTIFKHLLRTTTDPARRARLQQELQKLWLIRDRETKSTKNSLLNEESGK